jgi:hypothetical protein
MSRREGDEKLTRRNSPQNPWNTCSKCLDKQTAYYRAREQETLLQQKLYACAFCAFDIRREGRSYPKECLCHASRLCRVLCHYHKDKIERAARAPILIADEYLIRKGILDQKADLCINCAARPASAFSYVWSCKLCREWVQDTPEPSVDRKRG